MSLYKLNAVVIFIHVCIINAGESYESYYDYDYYDYWDCPENEYLDECATEVCQGEYCPLTDRDMTRDQCPLPDPCCCRVQRCMCNLNYLRNVTGECIPPNLCPPIKCVGPNEVLAPFPPTCPGESCNEAIMNPARCAIRPRLPVRAKPTCVCQKGYYRNNEKICVPYSQCPPQKCPAREFLNTCPPEFCSGQLCPFSPGSSLTCPPREKCGTPQCQCNFNYRRGFLGQCVPISQCRPFKCGGQNEEYQACPRICPGEKCTDYLRNVRCPISRIAVECRPDCRCKEGYYRNEKNLCVLASNCAAGVVASSDENEKLFTAEAAKFNQKFAKEIAANNPGKSVIFSAFSVEPLLAQLSLGTSGESHQQLLNVLGLKDDDFTKAVFPAVLGKIAKTEGVTLKIATRVYNMIGFEVEPSFQENSKNLFNSDLVPLDFSKSAASANTINSWVSANTNDKIKNLVSEDSLTDLTRLVLVNALYFKGDWKVKFNKDATRDGDFHVSPTKTVKTPMMHITSNYKFYESSVLDCKILELPYEKDQASMVIFLPNKVDGLSDLLAKMQNTAVVEEEKKKMFSTEVIVQLPKFKIETKTDLKQILRKIGIEKIFGADSGLDKLLTNKQEKLFVSEAIQKAFIEVNEEGAEAAAANAFAFVSYSAIIEPEPLSFVADRPFLFSLQANKITLFNGIYAN